MNVKRGLVRLGVALSVIYWGWAGVRSYEAAKAEEGKALKELEVFDSQLPWQKYWTEYKIKVADGRTITVQAPDRKTAEQGAAEVAKQIPRNWLRRRKLSAAWSALSKAAVPYLWTVALLAGVAWVVRGFKMPKSDTR
jgi:hypothetical protein